MAAKKQTAFPHLVNSAISDETVAGAKLHGSGASITRDGGFDSKLEEFETQTWMSRDPMTETLAKAKQENPGHAFRFLSDRVCARNGMRGFKTVTGHNGDPVVVAGMKLGYMPQELADQRAEYLRNEYRESMDNATNSYTEAQDRMIREAGAVGSFDTLKPGSAVHDPNHPGSDASIGLSRMRGGQTV